MTTSEFCEGLAKQFQDVSTILAEHISDNDEILPYVFLEDVSRYILADRRCRREIVAHLESAFNSKGPDVEDLIAIAFVEHLVDREEFDKATQGVDVPRLASEWERQQVS